MHGVRSRLLFISLVVVAAVVLWFDGAAAQGADEPDLGSGWELRYEGPMPLGTMVAGSAEAGFVVRDFAGILWSPDGLDWSRVSEQNSIGHGLAATDGGFVGLQGNMPVRSVMFSPDGRLWESVSTGFSASFSRVQSGPAGFLVIGDRDCDLVVRYAADGRDWSSASLPEGCNTLVAAPLGAGWIGVSEVDDDIVVLSSNDGITWRDIGAAMPPPALPMALNRFPGYQELQGLASLSSDGETLVLAGAGASGMWVSVDEGDTWAKSEIDPGRVEMAVGELGFVGVSPQHVFFSADGERWTEHSVEMDFGDVAVAGDTVVAVATDGIYTWTAPHDSGLALTGTSTRPLLIVAGVLVALGGLILIARRRMSLRLT